MALIKDVSSALQVFEEAANLHALATEQGDYKTANKSYNQIIKSVSYLKEQNLIDRLFLFLSHSSIGVRMWAATFLLPKYEKDGLRTLEAISKSTGIHSLTAITTINEWKKGSLKL